MADNDAEFTRNSILYELLVLSEWIENYDSVISKNTLSSFSQETSSFFGLWKAFHRNSEIKSLRYLQTEYPWHLAVSKDGKVVAVLQETLLEIKTAKDEYCSVVGKACIPNDRNPKLRKLAWSPDSSFLAVARDNGIVLVYNLFGCNIATVEPLQAQKNNTTFYPVVGLCFLPRKSESTKWSNELLIIYQKGEVKSILLSTLEGYEFDENIKHSLESYYPEGISSVEYDSHNLLMIAGPQRGSEHGIIVWRILNDYPYLKSAFDAEKRTQSSRSYLRYFPGFSDQNDAKTVIKMRVSPDGKSLACLLYSGEISLRRMPSLQLLKKWTLQQQPQYNISCKMVTGKQSFLPVDISWWSDTALVIARKNGALSVCSTSTLDNLLGDAPEFLAESPQISSIEGGDRPTVIALECETACQITKDSENDYDSEEKSAETSALQASIRAAIYSVTDIERFEPKRKTPKIISRTYRLIALKRTTPEELYARKINHEEYEDALLLAKKYNLDCDLVYQKRWRNSLVSKESIYSCLDKVTKTLWVIKECVDRVPETLEDAKELLEFGLKKTNLCKTSPVKRNAEQQQLVAYRRQLLKFLDCLTTYKIMIGSTNKYNSQEYDGFRRKSAIAATVGFARSENPQAVSIMFTYAGKEVLPHWLPVLSNFPETLSPKQYLRLLPEVVDGAVVPWEVKKLRDLDWSETESYELTNSTEIDAEEDALYREDPHLREFQNEVLTTHAVEEWYRKRAYEIENRTGLVENASDFVGSAMKRGVKNLDELYDNLDILNSLVYDLEIENMTLTKLEALNDFEKCKLLLLKTNKDSLVHDLKSKVLPFALRLKSKGSQFGNSFLRDILLHFSESSLELPSEFFKYIKSNPNNPFHLSVNDAAFIILDCMYSCTRDDQYETYCEIFQCLPERTDTSSKEELELHDRIDRLQYHLSVCEILNDYNIPKSVHFIRENENNCEVGKELMEIMIENTIKQSSDFGQLLYSLQCIQSCIFPDIPTSFFYELFALKMMSSEEEEYILSVEEILQCRRGEDNKMIPFERSVELVLEAARSHFEKAIDFKDDRLRLAQVCLSIISDPDPEINKELDLIKAVQLLGSFKVFILPLKVRKHDDRMKLIEACLKGSPENYRACQKLLQLANTLRICGDDASQREGDVLMLITRYALSYSDYEFASEICCRLIRKNYTPAWKVILLLTDSEYDDIKLKKLFLAFAILHCPVERLEEIIESRVSLHSKHFVGLESTKN